MYPDLEYKVHDGVGIVLIRRAASTSMNRTLGGAYETNDPDVPMHAFIRDPIGRVHSGFLALPGSIPKLPDGNMEYPEYADLILSGEKERHWDPQAEIISGIENLTCYRFEDLSEMWPILGFPKLQAHHICIDVEIPDRTYRLKELMGFYAADYELRYGHCRQ